MPKGKNLAFALIFLGKSSLLWGGSDLLDTWWPDPSSGALPLYRAIETPDDAELYNSHAIFAPQGRLLIGGQRLHLFDGQRWQSFPTPGGDNIGLVELDPANRLWINSAGRVGFFDWTTEKRIESLQPTWINDLAPEGSPLGFAFAARGSPTGDEVMLAMGEDFWLWRPDDLKLLFRASLSIAMPIPAPDEWWIGPGNGSLARLSSEGVQTLVRTEFDSGFIWARRDPSGSYLAGGEKFIFQIKPDGTARRLLEGYRQPLDGGWILASANSPQGWTADFSFSKGFLIIPAGLNPAKVLAYEAPGLQSVDAAPNRIINHRFDPEGNLWMNTIQGLYQWEHPGLAWSWLGASQPIFNLTGSETAILVESGVGLYRFDRKQGRLDLVGNADELVFDALDHPAGLLTASRGFVELHRGDRRLASDPVDQDIIALQDIGNSEEFVAVGRSTFFVGHLSEDSKPTLHALLELPEEPTDVARVGHRFYVGLTSGTILEVRLERDVRGQHRLAGSQLLRPFADKQRSVSLLRWGGAMIAFSGAQIAVLREGRIEQVHTLVGTGAEILAGTTDTSGHLLLALLLPNEKKPVFAEFGGLSQLQKGGELFWYPGQFPVGQLSGLAYDSRRDHLWIGGSKGLFSFERSLLRPLSYLPPIHLETSFDNGHTWALATPKDRRRLPFAQARVRFRWFTEGWYLDPPLRWEARLGGFSDEWVATENFNREFAGLRERDYTFAVRVTDALGTERHQIAYAFTVLPPWYRSSWAFAAYLFVAVAIVYLVFRLYSIRQRIRRAYLERIVLKRTAELESANEVKSEFLANMSHELRNPMNGVVGLTELLTRSELSSEQSRMVKTLRSCSEQLSRMINDVLDFAKMEAGRLTLDKRPFHAPSMVENAIDITSWDATQSSHHVVSQATGEAPFLVIGDDAKISQILINFISNACKYSEPGEILVQTRYRVQLRNRLNMRIEVQDGGPGLTEEERGRVFERFFRSPRAASSTVRGSGLGLAVCAELAELMGAHIGVEPNQHGGSTFFLEVTLPLPEGAEHAPSPIDYDTAYMGTVLVVDDMDYNRLVAAGILESLGFTVTSVSTGHEAIECLIATDYDFAFIDFELPDMNGPEILRNVVEEKESLRTRCFAVTAYAGEAKRKRCLEAGFLGFVSKPISRIKLREALISSGLDAKDLASGAYQQSIRDVSDDSYDLEPLLLLARGSMSRLMERCEEYIRILRVEVSETLRLAHASPPNGEAIAKQLHRLTSHGSIVKAERFLESVDALRQRIKTGRADGSSLSEGLSLIEERTRELAINLRRVVEEYRSRA